MECPWYGFASRGTNNPLERFGRELNAAILAPHHIIPACVATIDNLFQRYVRLLSEIAN